MVVGYHEIWCIDPTRALAALRQIFAVSLDRDRGWQHPPDQFGEVVVEGLKCSRHGSLFQAEGRIGIREE